MTKVAIVTAAGRGIGAGIAKALADDGFIPALLSPGGTVEALGKSLGGFGVRGSVTEPADLKRLVDETLQRYGRIDAVVTNTGHPPKGPLLEISDADWVRGFDMVMLNVIRTLRLVTPVMVTQKAGAVVNISSAFAFEPETDFPMTTLRGALSTWTKLYAETYAKAGIRANCLLPGFTDSLPEKADRRARIPMGRYARVEEIANAAAFLVSDKASYITGQSLRVDGGITRMV